MILSLLESIFGTLSKAVDFLVIWWILWKFGIGIRDYFERRHRR